MLKNWFKIYVYNGKKNKVYFLLTILCLTIGVTAVMFATLYWKEERSFDQWNENKEKIYFIESQSEDFSTGYIPYVLSRLLKEQHSFVEDYLLYSGYFPSAIGYKDKEYPLEKILQTNEHFFDFFPYPLVYGSGTNIFENPKEIAIEKEKAALIFGKGVDPIGKQVVVDEEHYTIVGVYHLEGKRSSFMPEAVVNDHQFIADDLKDMWDYSSSSVLIKTTKGELLTQVATEVYNTYYLKPFAEKNGFNWDSFEEETQGIYNRKIIPHVLTDSHFADTQGVVTPEPKAKNTILYSIMGLAWVLLILSLFNYVILSLTQSTTRAKEVGVRRVLGASQFETVKQTLVETSIVLLLVNMMSLLLVMWGLPFANAFLATHMEVTVKEALLMFLGICLLGLCIGGFIPAIYRAKYKTLHVLKGDYHHSRSSNLLKNSFLILQFAIACWFITGTVIIYRQLNYMTTKDLGFKGDQVISFNFLDGVDLEEKNKVYQTFKQEALKIKGVKQIGISDLDYREEEKSRYVMLFPFEGQNQRVEVYHVEEGYLEMMSIALLEGRYLNRELANDSIQNALINECLLRQLKKENIEELVLGDRKIVGVVKDFHTAGLAHTISPKMFLLPIEKRFYFEQISVKVDLEQLETVIPAIEKLWQTFNRTATQPFAYSFIDQKFAKTFEKTKTQQHIMLFLSYLVLFIALFGLFAVSSFSIGSRMKEIAIRRVLGAEVGTLIGKLTYQYLIYCVIGFGLSVFPSYYLLNKWLEDYAYRITIDYEVYVVCFLLIVLLTLVVVVSRAYKATRVNVLTYIKYE